MPSFGKAGHEPHFADNASKRVDTTFPNVESGALGENEALLKCSLKAHASDIHLTKTLLNCYTASSKSEKPWRSIRNCKSVDFDQQVAVQHPGEQNV